MYISKYLNTLNMLDIKNSFQKVIQKLIPKYQVLDKEKSVEELLTSILELDDTKVIHSPISGIYYVFNSSLGYNLRVTRYNITVSNHDFSFQEDLSEAFSKHLNDLLDAYLESEISNIEREVEENRMDLLGKMKNRILIKYGIQQKNQEAISSGNV